MVEKRFDQIGYFVTGAVFNLSNVAIGTINNPFIDSDKYDSANASSMVLSRLKTRNGASGKPNAIF